MNISKIIKYALYIIAFSSALIASGVRESADWWNIVRPFFIVFAISITIALTMTYINKIRRVTYPIFVCMSAWFYKHNIIMTKFTRNTYRLYKWKNRSYKNLFEYVQNLFDIMYA